MDDGETEMIRVWIFKETRDGPIEYKYEKHLDALESIIRGECGNLIVVKGMTLNDMPEMLLKTLELIVLQSGGFIIFPDENIIVHT